MCIYMSTFSLYKISISFSKCITRPKNSSISHYFLKHVKNCLKPQDLPYLLLLLHLHLRGHVHILAP